MDAEMAAAEMARVEMAREVVAAAMAGAATVMAAAAMAAAAMAMAAVAAMAQERPSASAFRSLQVLEQLAAVWTGQAGAAQVHEVMASTPLVAVLRLIAHIIVLVTSRSLQQFRAEMAPSRGGKCRGSSGTTPLAGRRWPDSLKCGRFGPTQRFPKESSGQ
jgi:hypothetical protein